MTAEKMRQSDFAEKHKLTPGEVKELRDKYLTEGKDYWSEGRPIFWSAEAVALVEVAMQPKKGLAAYFEKPEGSSDVPTEQDFKDTINRLFVDTIPHPEYPSGNVSISYKNPVDFMAQPPGQISSADFYPQGEDAAHEVAAALSAARQKNMASLVTADQQSAPFPEAEGETALPPVETPENFSAFVTKPCRNKRFVYADFNGEKVAVSCHPRHQLKIVRKNIRVRVEKEGETTRYIHVP